MLHTLEPAEVEIVEDCHPCSKASQLRKSIKVSRQCKPDKKPARSRVEEVRRT